MGEDDDGSVFGALLASSGVLALGLAVQLGLGFLVRLIVARWLGKVGYGAVSLGFTLLVTASIVVVAGTDSGVGRFLPRYDDPARRRGVLVSAFQVVVPLAVAAGVLAAALAGPIATHAFGDPSVEPVLRAFGLAIPLAAFVRLTVGSIRGMQETLPRVYIENLVLPLTRLGLIVVALVVGLGAVGVAWAYAGAYAVAAVLAGVYLVRETPLVGGVEAAPMRRELLVFSAPLMVTATMHETLANLDTFMLGYFASTGDVGIYNVAYPLGRLLIVLLIAFSFLFMPVISELHSAGRLAAVARTYHVVSKWIFLASLPPFLLVVTYPSVVIRATFGAEYAAGGLALSVLAVGFFVHAVAGPTNNALVAFGRTRRVMAYTTVTAVANAALNLVLIPRYSYLGAAVATTAGYLLLNGLFLARIRREIGTHPFRAAMLRPGIAAGLVWLLLVLGLRALASASLATVVVALALFLPVYAVVVLRFGGVEEAEVELLGDVEERLDVDLGPVRRVARRLAG